jgi:lipopolysaccharide exporter
VSAVASLGRRAVRGAIWTITSSIGSRIVGLVGTLAVTRFIAPADFGEVAVATVLVLTAQQVSTLGLGQYLIAHPEAGRDAAFHVTAYHMALGLLAYAALFAIGAWLGPLLEAPRAMQFLPGLVLAAALDRLSYVPERILVRDLRFGTVSAGRTAGDLAYSVGSVALAAVGWGAMAIVAGNVLRSVLRSTIFIGGVKLRDWLAPCSLDRATTRSMFAYGLPLSIGALAAFASRRWDNLLVSRFFGPGPTGLYNLAYNLADVPAIQVGEQIGDVLFPSFARLEPERRKQALVQSVTLLALIVFPLAVGLGAVANTLVRVLFDERWEAVGPMLMLLSALSITRPIGWTIASYLQARRLTKTVMVLEVLKALAVVISIATIGRAGVLWTCGAVGIAFALHTLGSMWAVQRADGISMWRMLVGLAGPLAACAPMVLAVLGVRRALEGSAIGAIGALGLETSAGAIAYVISALIVARSASREVASRLIDALRRR